MYLQKKIPFKLISYLKMHDLTHKNKKKTRVKETTFKFDYKLIVLRIDLCRF